MTENVTSEGSQTEGAGPQASSLAAMPKVVGDMAKNLSVLAADLQEIGLGALAAPVLSTVTVLNAGSARMQSVLDAVSGESQTGTVGKVLNVASAILGEGSTENDSGEEEGEGGILEKVREKVNALRGIWDEYYKNLFTKEGKLNKEKAKAMAMEVGETILGAKKMAKVKRALAIANVIRGRAEAVMVAAKSAPFPANLLPIAKAFAFGTAQLGVVKGQAHDGLTNVPSTGTYLLEKGERVVGSRLNADLQTFLSGQALGFDGGSRVDNRTNVNNSPSINLTINGDASEEAVASNRGALEGMIRDIFADYAMDAPFG